MNAREPRVRGRFHDELQHLDGRIEQMGAQVLQALTTSIGTLEALDVARAKALIEDDNLVDAARHEIDEAAFYLLATQQPTAVDLRLLMSFFSVTTELERIGDYCSGIAKITLTMAAEPKGPPDVVIRKMTTLTEKLLQQGLTAFRERDAQSAATVWARDDDIDDLYRRFFQDQIEDMVDHRNRVRRGTYMLWVAHNLERIADRVTNIAEAVAFVATGDVASWRAEIESETVP